MIVGEIQLVEGRDGNELTDKEMITMLKKFKKSATEMVKYGDVSGNEELEILERYLPSTMSIDEIKSFMLDGYADEINNADNVMRLIGKFKKLLDGKAEGGTIKDALLGIKQK